MDTKQIGELLVRVEQALSANDERFMEIEAMLSAQRFLLEQVYANAFVGNTAGFAQFIDDALEKTRSSTTATGPMASDVKSEISTRIATHIARFGDSVKRRLA